MVKENDQSLENGLVLGFSVIAAVYTGVFGLLYVSDGNFALAALHFVSFAFVVMLFLYYQQTKNYHYWSLSILIIATFLFFPVLLTGGYSSRGYLMTFAYVSFVVFLNMGRMPGGWLGILAGVHILTFTLQYFNIGGRPYPTAEIISYLTALTVVILSSYFFEYLQKREVEKLQKQKEKLVNAELKSRFGTWEFNLENKHMQWSPGVSLLLNASHHPEEQSLDEFLIHIHDEDRPRIEKIFRAKNVTSDIFSEKFRVMLPEKKPALLFLQAIGTEKRGERIVRMTGSLQDITKSQASSLKVASEESALNKERELFLTRESEMANLKTEMKKLELELERIKQR